MVKKSLLFVLSFSLLITSTVMIVGSLVSHQSARAMTLASHAAITGTVATDSFQRTTTSGWGNASTGGWWTVAGSHGPLQLVQAR